MSVLKAGLLKARTSLGLQACVRTFQLRKFPGWGSEGVTLDWFDDYFCASVHEEALNLQPTVSMTGCV